MNSEIELIKRIEAYLFKEMSLKELNDFDFEKTQNPSIDDKISQHKLFLKSIESYGNRKKLIEEMNLFHDEIDVEDLMESSTPVVSIWKKYRRSFAVAASVAIVVTLITLLSTGQFNKKTQNISYSALKRDMESIKRSQNALIREIKSQNTSTVAPNQFGGTGFALSSSGYLITNYHVVEGADSIYVQNNKGESFKVQSIYIDPAYDIAVLQIVDPLFTSLNPLPYTFKKLSSDLGENVYTIGYPRDDIVYGDGYLSSQTGFDGDSIAYQVSIPVNPGNSGGPLLDNKGNIIGIISGKQTLTDGAAFAIKSDFLLKAIDNIPQDSLTKKLIINKKNNLLGLTRTQQVKKMKDYIFMVKVYN